MEEVRKEEKPKRLLPLALLASIGLIPTKRPLKKRRRGCEASIKAKHMVRQLESESNQGSQDEPFRHYSIF